MVIVPSLSVSFSYLFVLDDVDPTSLELNCSFSGGKECIVFSHPDISAGKEFSAALSNDNRAWLYRLSAEKLYAPVLGVAVPAVAGRTLSFFMCHRLLPLKLPILANFVF